MRGSYDPIALFTPGKQKDMDRRHFLSSGVSGLAATLLGMQTVTQIGCRGRQVAHILDDHDSNMVGSHEAGAETYNRLVEESVARLLGQEMHAIQQVSHTDGEFMVSPKRICFVGVENKTAEELGDFRDQLYQLIDTEISHSQTFQSIDRRYVDAGLKLTRLRPDELFLPTNQREFAATMEQEGTPFNYLMFAELTSGTTKNNRDMQRDYLLTLSLVNIHTGERIKESAKIRKGYHKSRIGKWRNYNPLKS